MDEQTTLSGGAGTRRGRAVEDLVREVLAGLGDDAPSPPPDPHASGGRPRVRVPRWVTERAAGWGLMLHVWRDERGRLWGHRVDWLAGQGVYSIDRFRILDCQVAEAAAAGELVEVELSEPCAHPAPADPAALRRLLGHPSVLIPSDPDEDDGPAAEAGR